MCDCRGRVLGAVGLGKEEMSNPVAALWAQGAIRAT